MMAEKTEDTTFPQFVLKREDELAEFEFTPQPDITAFELASLLRTLASRFFITDKDMLARLEDSPNLMRHLTKVEK